MSQYSIEKLDPRNTEDVRSYEEGFYRAFLPKSNPGIRAIWIWDDEAKRLKTRIPYEDQAIFFLRDKDGQVNTAGAVNYAGRDFQSVAYGFPKPADQPTWLEILTVFNSSSEHGPRAALSVFESARDFLVPQGYAHVYATCAEYSLNWNARRGWDILERSDRGGVIRYFLKRTVEKPFVLG